MSDLSQFSKKGYIHIPSFFSKEEIEHIRVEAKNVFITKMLNLGILSFYPTEEKDFEIAMRRFFETNIEDFVNCGKQAQHLISLHRLGTDERIESTLKRLGLEFPNICTRPVLFFNSKHLAKKETYWKVFPHQDWRSMQGSLDSVVVWIPLVDVDISLGALEVVEESHKLGLLENEIVDNFGKICADALVGLKFIPLEVKQGDAVFFSSFLVHQSGNNSTDSIRWSCHFRYNNLVESTFVDRGLPNPYLYKPDEELLTPGFPTLENLRRLFP